MSVCLIFVIVALLGAINVIICSTLERLNIKIEFKNIVKYIVINFIIAVWIYFKYNTSIETIMYIMIVNIVLVIAYIDYLLHIIPNRLNSLICALGILFWIIKCYLLKIIFIQNIVSILLVFILFISIYFITLCIYKKEGIGFGDIKFITSLAIYFSIQDILYIILLSYVLAACISAIAIFLKYRKIDDQIAFGPYISLATCIIIVI